MSNRIVILALFLAMGSATSAVGSEPAPVKPREVSTVGITPAAFTAADRAKLAEVGRRLAAANARPAVWRPAAPSSAVKPPDAATRSAAVGVRNREKPVQVAPAPAGRP